MYSLLVSSHPVLHYNFDTFLISFMRAIMLWRFDTPWFDMAILLIMWHSPSCRFFSHPLSTLCSRTPSECERIRNLQWPWRGLLSYLKMLLHLKMLCSIS